MGRCHILGLKGYESTIKKQAEDSAAGVTRIHYPWVGTVFLYVQIRYYAKKGEAGRQAQAPLFAWTRKGVVFLRF